jgi:hypothetical protein
MVLRLVFLFLALILPSAVHGSFATLYQFNGGVNDVNKSCDAVQWALVQATITNATKYRRLGKSRQLGGACIGCGPYCAKLGLGCVVRSRRCLKDTGAASLEHKAVSPKPANAAHRELGACDQEINRVTVALDVLMAQTPSTLVDSCRALIAPALRNFTCVQTTQDCFVQSFNLWDARNNVILNTTFTSGGWFCGGRRRPVSFEANANFYIGKMQFVVRGNSTNFYGTTSSYFTNRTEYSAPYFLNGNYDNGAPGGTTFNPGNYVLTATSEDDATQAKSISFQVRNCNQ